MFGPQMTKSVSFRIVEEAEMKSTVTSLLRTKVSRIHTSIVTIQQDTYKKVSSLQRDDRIIFTRSLYESLYETNMD